MGLPAEKPRRATYADLEAVPQNKVAEILNGVLHVFPRPAPRQAYACTRLSAMLVRAFDMGDGGLGGWLILREPEIHLGPAGTKDVVVPDITGWRIKRMPKLPRTPYFPIAPDWVCEILSDRTEAIDRAVKLPIYAREGVHHVWLVNPIIRLMQVFALNADRRWTQVAVHHGSLRVRAAPFEELELDLSLLWPDGEPSENDDEETTPAPPPSKPKRAKTPKRARKR